MSSPYREYLKLRFRKSRPHIKVSCPHVSPKCRVPMFPPCFLLEGLLIWVWRTLRERSDVGCSKRVHGLRCRVGQASRGLIGRLRSSPRVGLPDMMARFEIRRHARRNPLPSPACPLGSKVSPPATQRPNVILVKPCCVKTVLPSCVLPHRKGRVVHESQRDLSRTFGNVASQRHVKMVWHPSANLRDAPMRTERAYSWRPWLLALFS